jgi:hypothetical protein
MLPLVDHFCEHALKKLSTNFKIVGGWMKPVLARIPAHLLQMSRRRRCLTHGILLHRLWRRHPASPLRSLKPEVVPLPEDSLVSLGWGFWRTLENYEKNAILFLFSCYSFDLSLYCSCLKYLRPLRLLFSFDVEPRARCLVTLMLSKELGRVLPVDLNKDWHLPKFS